MSHADLFKALTPYNYAAKDDDDDDGKKEGEDEEKVLQLLDRIFISLFRKKNHSTAKSS